MDHGDVNFTSIDSNSNHRVVKSACDNVDFASSLWFLLATMSISRRASGFCLRLCRSHDEPLDSASDYVDLTTSLWILLPTMSISRRASGFCFRLCRIHRELLESACDNAEFMTAAWNVLAPMRMRSWAPQMADRPRWRLVGCL